MRSHLVRTFSSHGLLAVLLSMSLLGCLTKVDSTAGTVGKACTSDKNCREDLRCGSDHRCYQPGAGVDASARDAVDGRSDGAQASDSRTVSDGKADVVSTVKLDTNAAPDLASGPDAAIVEGDVPALQPDAPTSQPDVPVLQPDVPGSPDTRPADVLPCSGGCTPDKPVCSNNACVGCKLNDDCKGYSLTVCKSTGACVQCTEKAHCTGTMTCNSETNQCVGCAKRSDCQGACQTCSNSTCVPVKNDVDSDLSKCAGTCDSQGQCKAKQGQKCSVASDCLNNMACADGVCCNRACAGTCEACDLPSGPPGTCTPLTAGSQPRHGTCANTGTGVANATCAGSCQGKPDGTCTYAPTTTQCGTAGCATDTSSQAAGTCNSTGLCSMPSPVSCKTGGTCTDGACGCPSTLPKPCANACVDTKTDKKNCGECGHDCLGGECLGGICQPVVITKPAISYRIDVFGLDSQNIYYLNGTTQVSSETLRIGINAVNSSGTSLRDEATLGVLGLMAGNIYYARDRSGEWMYCQASSCRTTLENLTTVGSGKQSSFGVPVPNNYSVWGFDESDPYAPLKITWYDSSNNLVTSWPDDVTSSGDHSFYGSGDTVYWIRPNGTDQSLYAVDSTNRTRTRLVAQLPISINGVVGVSNLNAKSLFVTTYPEIYRIPLPQGTGTSAPPLVLSAAADAQYVIEDDNYIYWSDSAGTIYKCRSNDLVSCQTSRILLTTTGPATGFFQDSKNLYWGTSGTNTNPNGQLLRMAK